MEAQAYGALAGRLITTLISPCSLDETSQSGLEWAVKLAEQQAELDFRRALLGLGLGDLTLGKERMLELLETIPGIVSLYRADIKQRGADIGLEAPVDYADMDPFDENSGLDEPDMFLDQFVTQLPISFLPAEQWTTRYPDLVQPGDYLVLPSVLTSLVGCLKDRKGKALRQSLARHLRSYPGVTSRPIHSSELLDAQGRFLPALLRVIDLNGAIVARMALEAERTPTWAVRPRRSASTSPFIDEDSAETLQRETNRERTAGQAPAEG